MAYKRYIKRGGKLYGPYVYHSVKRDGKVVSEYIKQDEIIVGKDKNSKRYLIVGILFSLLILSVFFVFLFKSGITGRASLQIENNYQPGEKIIGSVKLILKKGELVPANTKIVIDNSGQQTEYLLNDLLSDVSVGGIFYVENKDISGSGQGFGAEGEKTSYPEVSFTLKITESEKEAGKDEEKKSETINETAKEQIAETPPTPTPVEETTTEPTQEKEKDKTKENVNQNKKVSENLITENNIPEPAGANNQESEPETTSESNPITGAVVSENLVDGEVSFDSPFTYQLSEGQTAEIVSSEQDVKLKIKDNIATVTTDYEEIERGFGEEYLSDETSELNIDLSKLNLIAQEGELSVKLIYNEQELVSASEKVSVGGENITNEKELKEKKPKKDIIDVNASQIVIVNESEEEVIAGNITIGNATIDTIQYSAVLGKSVKWKKIINLDYETANISVGIHKQAENITVYKIISGDIKEEIKQEVVGESDNPSFGVTANVIEVQETSEQKEVTIDENATEFEIDYETPAPVAYEKDIVLGKEIIISSDVHYENVLAFTYLPQEIHDSRNIVLYHIVNETKTLTPFEFYDTNGNNLIDYIEWTIPGLSNQSYELEIKVLNVQSYPTVGGVWEVRFTTIGSADLTIMPVQGTTWSNENENWDLKLLEIRCNKNSVDYDWVNNSVFIQNYSCNDTGYEISKVITQGKHHLEFDFGGMKAYAHNTASGPIPQTINLHGKLTNSSGNAINGTYNMTFKIYDGTGAGASKLWESANNSISVDSNGVYNHILSNVNISFAGDYYLGITVENDSEMTPRINLTSAPYSFRANISDTLDISKNYRVANLTADYFIGNGSLLTGVCLANGSNCQVASDTQKTTLSIYLYNDTNTIYFNETQLNTTINNKNSNLLNLSGTNANQDINISLYNFQAGNLTLSDKIIFRLGEMIDNLVDGFITITGGLNVTGNIVAGGNVTALYYFGNGSQLTDISGNNIINTKNWINNTNITTLCNSSGSCFTLSELNTSIASANFTNVAYLNNTQTFTGNNTFNGNVNISGILDVGNKVLYVNISMGSVGIGGNPEEGNTFEIANANNYAFVATRYASDTDPVPRFWFRKAAGTYASPASVGAGYRLMSIDVDAYNNGQFRSALGISGKMSSKSGDNVGAKWSFLTASSTTSGVWEVMNLDENKNVNISGGGSLFLPNDNQKLTFGTGYDANIFWDGNNLVFNTTAVSSGNATFTGNVDLRNGNLTINNKICNSTACFTLSELNTTTASANFTNVAFLNNSQVFTGVNNFTNNTNVLGNFSVNNTDFFVDVNNGRVGIGTKNPLGIIHVSAVNNSNAFRIDGATGNIGISSAPSNNALVLITKDVTSTTSVAGLRVSPNFVPSSPGSFSETGITGIVDYSSLNWSSGSSVSALSFITRTDVVGQNSGNNNLTSRGIHISNYNGDAYLTLKESIGLNIIPFQIVAIDSTPTLTEDNAYGIKISDISTIGAVGAITITNQTGIYIAKQTKATNNYGIVLAGDGAGADLVLGDGQDAKIYWDGDNLVFNTTAVSSGNATFTGGVNIASGMNYSVGGNRGLNGNYSVGSCWIKFTGGIATSTNCTAY